MPRTQSYATHRRWFPLFHFVLQPLLAVNLVLTIVWATREPTLARWWAVAMAAALILISVTARLMALTVQNRLIRLEQRLRLAAVLPPDLRGRVAELRTRQLLALRFASDAELPALVRRCLAGELRSADAVKREIREWQPDFLRV
jgi:hypothetical protein